MKFAVQNSPVLLGFLDSFGGVGEVFKVRLPDGQTLAAARQPASRSSVREYRASYLKQKQTSSVSPRAKR